MANYYRIENRDHEVPNVPQPGRDRPFKNAFSEPDIVEIVDAIDAALRELPEFDAAIHMTEDSPRRFDIQELPSTIEFLASLRGGQIQQHLAGLDIRLQTLLSDERMMGLIGPHENELETGGRLATVRSGSSST